MTQWENLQIETTKPNIKPWLLFFSQLSTSRFCLIKKLLRLTLKYFGYLLQNEVNPAVTLVLIPYTIHFFLIRGKQRFIIRMIVSQRYFYSNLSKAILKNIIRHWWGLWDLGRDILHWKKKAKRDNMKANNLSLTSIKSNYYLAIYYFQHPKNGEENCLPFMAMSASYVNFSSNKLLLLKK